MPSRRGSHQHDEFDPFDIDDELDPAVLDRLDDEGPLAIRRSRAVRWTAILVVASFALAGVSSLLRFF
ncbi:MAG: hypothetical protein R2743_02090 [Ilumatobacteraceae bacterium]